MSKESFFSRDPRRAVAIAWAVGLPLSASLLILGLLGDGEGFWGNRPYLTNILTALTGAGVGVPFALTVLNGYARIQASAATWNSTWNYANQLVFSLERDIDAASGGDVTDPRLRNLMRRLQDCQDRLAHLGKSATSTAHQQGVDRDLERVRRVHSEAIELAQRQIGEIGDIVETILPSSDESDNIGVNFNNEWDTLDRVVRPRIAETEGSWIPLDAYKVLSYRRHEFLSSDSVLKTLRSIEGILANGDLTSSQGLPVGDHFGSSNWDILRLPEIIERVGRLVELRTAVYGLRRAVDALKK